MGFCRFLTPEGVEYLREFLNLPAEIVPATHKSKARGPERSGGPSGPRRFDDGPRDGGREGYRSGPRDEKVFTCV